MDAKVLLLIALLAPILMLAAGIFARRGNAGHDTGNARPGGSGEDRALLRP
jgi:hypothetical protein